MDQSEDELGLMLSEEEELEDKSTDTVDLYGDLYVGSNSERREEEGQCLQPKKENASCSRLEKGDNAQYQVESSRNDIFHENNLYDSILLSTDLEKYREVIADLRSQVDTLKMQLKKTQKLCQDYDADNKILLKNMSSLWKVAKADLRKSNEAYKKVCKEQDALIFRRAMHQIPRGEIIRILTQLGNFPRDDFKQFMEILRGSKTDVCTCQSGSKASLKGDENYSPITQKVNGRRLRPVRSSTSGKPWLFTSTPKEETEKLHHHCREEICEEEENASVDKLKNINRNDDNVQMNEKSKIEMKMRKISSKRNDTVIGSVDEREQRYSRSSHSLRSRANYKKARGANKECIERKSKRESLDSPGDHQHRAKHRQNKKESPHTKETPKGRGRRSERQDSSCKYGKKEEMMARNENCTSKISKNCEEEGTTDKTHSLSSKKDIEMSNHSVVRSQPSRTSRKLFKPEESQKEKNQGDTMVLVDNRSEERGDSDETQYPRADVLYTGGIAVEKISKEKSHQECTLPCKGPKTGGSFPAKNKCLEKSELITNKTQSASQKSNDVDNLPGLNSSPKDGSCELKETVGDNEVIKNNAKANMESSSKDEAISGSSDQVKNNQYYGKDMKNIDALVGEDVGSNSDDDRSLSRNENGQEQEACSGSVIPVLGENVETSLVKTRSKDEVKTVSESGEESLEEGEISDNSEEDKKKKRYEQSGYRQEMSCRLSDDETRKSIRKKPWESNWRTRERWEKGRDGSEHQEEKNINYSRVKESKNSPSPHKSRRSLGEYREMEKSLHRSRKGTLVCRQQRIGRRAMSREKIDGRDYRRKSFASQRDLGRERKLRESVRDKPRRDTAELRHRSPKKRKTSSRDSTRKNWSGIAEENSKKPRKDERKTRTKSPVSKRTGLRSAEKSKSAENKDDFVERKLNKKEETDKSPVVEKEKGNVEDTGDDTIDFLVSEHHKKYPLEVLMNAEDSESSLLQYIDTSAENIKDPKGETIVYTDQEETEVTSSPIDNSNDLSCLEETLVNIDIDCAYTDFSFCDGNKARSSTKGTKLIDHVFQDGHLNSVACGLNEEMRGKDVGDTSVSDAKISKSVSSTEQSNSIEGESPKTLGMETIHEENTKVIADPVSSSMCSAIVSEVRKTSKLHDIDKDCNGKSDRDQSIVDSRTLKWRNSLSPVNSAFSAEKSVDMSESLQMRSKVKKLDGSESGPSKLSDHCEKLRTHHPIQSLEGLSPKNSCVNNQFREENQIFQDRRENEFCNSYSNSDSSSSSSSDSDSDSSCSDTDCNCSDSSSCDSSPDKSTVNSPAFSQPNESLTHLSFHHSPDGEKSSSNSVSAKESRCKVSRPLHSHDESTSKIDSSCTYAEDQTSSKRQLVKSHEVMGSRGSCKELHLPASSTSSQVQRSSHFRGILDAAQPVIVRRKVRRNLDMSSSSVCSSSAGSPRKRLSPFNANNVISIVYTRDSKIVSTTDSLSFSSPSVCTKSTYSDNSVRTQVGDSPNSAAVFTSTGQILGDKINSPPRKRQKINSNHSISALTSTPEMDSLKPRKQISKNKQTVTPTRASPRKNSSPSSRRSPSPRRSPRKNYSQ